MTNPDRSDVPRSAARPLRYIDRYVTANQGEVFYMTEALTILEGIERGPAGNVSLAAAFHLAQELPQDEIIIVQETEYTGAGKHQQAQLSFARNMGIEIRFGNPQDEIPGTNIILPTSSSLIKTNDLNIDEIRRSLIKNMTMNASTLNNKDIEFLVEETNSTIDFVIETLNLLERKYEWIK